MNVYADNAATTRLSRAALSAMLPYLEDVYANPSSQHAAGQLAARALYTARRDIAEVLGALPNEIYFTSGGSESDNQAIFSAAAAGERVGKRHIVSTAIEHHAVLRALDELRGRGFEVTLTAPRENGIVDADDVIRAIRPDTALVSVMYANNETGAVQPIRKIGEACRKSGVTFHTDAVQAVGHIEVGIDCVDMLSFSAHKLHGPKGAGVLYVRRGTPLKSLIRGGGQERGKRAGTENLPAIVGMAAALKESVNGISDDGEKIAALRDTVVSGLLKIPGAVFNGDAQSRLPGIVNVSFDGIEGEALLLLLSERGVYAASGAACTAGAIDASHVLLAMGRSRELARAALRISLSRENTAADAEYIVKAVTESVKRLRGAE